MYIGEVDFCTTEKYSSKFTENRRVMGVNFNRGQLKEHIEGKGVQGMKS